MADEAKLHCPIHSTFFLLQLLKCQLCNVHSGIVENNSWAQSIHQCWLQALQFLVHCINLPSILVRCNGFAGIQKAVVDQMGSRPPNSDRDLSFFLVQIWLWESALELLLSPATELVMAGCCIKSTFHRISQSV